MKVTNNKSMTALAILTALLAGCNSESNTQTSTQGATPVAHTEQAREQVTTEPTTEPVITPADPVTDPVRPIIEPTPIEPAKPVVVPEPQKPTTPVFVPEGISTITQQPYSGTVIRGGDAYLRYDSVVTDFQDFELPEWKVTYRYEPFLEVLITDGIETLCARYSWKLKGFGYAKPQCLWSDTRQALPLTDMREAYYGYGVIETRVWVNGVVGLEIGAE